ncbi:MAG: four helix bundle protein [Bacteroidales bacterium]|nr:four helix bundle protein [Bacteroidales bacterium]
MDEKKVEFIEQIKRRTKDVAIRVVKMYRELPKQQEAWVIGKQILRSATSIAANYRAACRARSAKEYYHKISIVIEETDETLFWLEILVETDIFPESKLKSLMDEVNELLAIFSKSRQTMNNKKK